MSIISVDIIRLARSLTCFRLSHDNSCIAFQVPSSAMSFLAAGKARMRSARVLEQEWRGSTFAGSSERRKTEREGKMAIYAVRNVLYLSELLNSWNFHVATTPPRQATQHENRRKQPSARSVRFGLPVHS